MEQEVLEVHYMGEALQCYRSHAMPYGEALLLRGLEVHPTKESHYCIARGTHRVVARTGCQVTSWSPHDL